MDRINNENENERSTWRKSINFMYQRGDIEGLIELRDGPDELDDDIMQILNNFIEELEKTKKVR